MPRFGALINHPAVEPTVSIDPPVTQKWPVRPMLVDAAPIDIGHHNLLLINRSFGDDFAVAGLQVAVLPARERAGRPTSGLRRDVVGWVDAPGAVLGTEEVPWL